MHQPNSPLELQHPARASYATRCSLRGGELALPSPSHRQQSAAHAEDDFGTFDEVDISDPIKAPPSALTSASTAYDPHHDSPSPLEDYPHSARSGHSRSLTGTFLDNCQPFLNRASTTIQQHTARASFHQSTKSLANFIPTRSAIESGASQPKIRAGAKALQNWFHGASAPVNLGVGPSYDRDYSDDEYDSEADDDPTMMSIFNRSPTLTRPASDSSKQAQDSTPSKTQTQSPASNRFAWLLSTQKNAAVPPPAPSPTYHNPEDELLNLNISQALFPHGPVDPLAPSSFNDLLSTAEAIISRYQTSYRQLSTAVVDARAEQSAQDDELDEAETRVRHLKMQLESMAARANERDQQMQNLMEDLAIERRARQEEEAARKRSIALIREQAQCEHDTCQRSPRDAARRRNRISNSDISVDSGFESDCDTDAASVFSKTCLSPASTAPSTFETSPQESTPKAKLPQPMQRRSTYDKVRDGKTDLETGSWGCSNCEGGSQASVWARLAKEREETYMLKQRVEELETAVDGALNVVDGPWGL